MKYEIIYFIMLFSCKKFCQTDNIKIYFPSFTIFREFCTNLKACLEYFISEEWICFVLVQSSKNLFKSINLHIFIEKNIENFEILALLYSSKIKVSYDKKESYITNLQLVAYNLINLLA